MPPGIRESNERPGLKPARLHILQNGTTKKMVDAISHCSMANSPMIPPHAPGPVPSSSGKLIVIIFAPGMAQAFPAQAFFRDNGTSQFR